VKMVSINITDSALAIQTFQNRQPLRLQFTNHKKT